MDGIERFLHEDIGQGDITTEALIGERTGTARIVARDRCVVAGLEEAMQVFCVLGLRTAPRVDDGDWVPEGTELLHIEGDLRGILTGERVALNFMMRMSGIATATRDVVTTCRERNPAIIVAATRKTTPGFRFYEKKAVVLGGGDPHRYRLDDAILIKDNHLAIVGSISEAVARAKRISFTKKVEVEVVSLAGAQEAAASGADIILLDNMSPGDAAECAAAIKAMDGRIVVEASGGITPETAPLYALGVDVISLGWLTHSSRAVNLSLDITGMGD